MVFEVFKNISRVMDAPLFLRSYIVVHYTSIYGIYLLSLDKTDVCDTWFVSSSLTMVYSAELVNHYTARGKQEKQEKRKFEGKRGERKTEKKVEDGRNRKQVYREKKNIRKDENIWKNKRHRNEEPRVAICISQRSLRPFPPLHLRVEKKKTLQSRAIRRDEADR